MECTSQGGLNNSNVAKFMRGYNFLPPMEVLNVRDARRSDSCFFFLLPTFYLPRRIKEGGRLQMFTGPALLPPKEDERNSRTPSRFAACRCLPPMEV